MSAPEEEILLEILICSETALLTQLILLQRC
jgi:hypothetical protein